MRRSAGRWFVLAGMATTGVALLVALAVDLGRGPTPTAALIDGLHADLLLVAVPIAVVVEAALVYAVWRFRDNAERVPTPKNRRLELTWTVATAVVLVFVGVASYQVLAQPAVTAAVPAAADADAVRVDVTAHQWHWSVAYPDAGVSVEFVERIVLPVDRPVRITVGSADVIHSFHAPALGLKQDAIPGRRGLLRTRLTDPGEYRLYCAEYCGADHAGMTATIEVVPGDEYDAWLADRRNASTDGSG